MNKLFYFLIACFCMLLPITSDLSAATIGNTGHVEQYNGIPWSEVKFEADQCCFFCLLPYYQGAKFQNGAVVVQGSSGKVIDYSIVTSFSANFNPPNTFNEFLKLVEDANPSCIVNGVDAEEFGCKYVVDIIPKDPEEPLFVRFLVTETRLIKMNTVDSDPERRDFFFGSIYFQ